MDAPVFKPALLHGDALHGGAQIHIVEADGVVAHI
jgi:hypothetical protein